MFDCNHEKQVGKSRKILEKLENAEIKFKIFYLSHILVIHIFKVVNMLNFELQGKKLNLVTYAQQIKGYIEKLEYWKDTV